MTHSILPASPSWYCSRVIDSNNSGLLCFGAKHSVYVFDTSPKDTPLSLKYCGHIPAHQDRVVGVSFCKSDQKQNKICSASEDGKVKVWDLSDFSLSGEHSEHKHKLTVVHWSPVDNDLIVSADEKGSVISWRLSSGELKSFLPEPTHVFSLTCSSHNASHVAVGYKNGLVLVLDLSARAGSCILQRLRGHDDEIHSIVWCPQKGAEIGWRKNSPEEDADSETAADRSDYIVATGSRDKTIRVWSVRTGRALSVLHLPRNTGHRRVWEDGATKQRVWVTLHWPSQRPQHLISSSYNGDLLLWDLARPGNKSWQPFGGGGFNSHNRIVFNICSMGIQGQYLCTMSMDRQLILWDVESLNPIYSIPSFGGFVYSITQSPIHSGRLAVGVGDNLIRIWNVENTQQPYDVRTFWQGIKAKVTALSWHPKKEALLAFGTEDGKVGILDIIAARSNISSTYHKKTVYVVTWGPPSCNIDDKPSDKEFVLYSCGDGNVLQHNPSSLDKNATNVNAIIKKTNKMETRPPGRSEISWKPDYSVVALGNEDGTIDVFRPPNMKLLCSVHIHHKLVNCVRWHPEHTASSLEPSHNSFWLASGSNEAIIHVVDLRQSLTELRDDPSEPSVITESFCQLEGHTNRITGLSWSLHEDGMLASASYDWTAQVWDVTKCKPIANYRAHCGRLLSVSWSMLDPNIVYSGGDDLTLQAWNISAQAHDRPPAGSEKRKHRTKHKGGRGKVSGGGEVSSPAVSTAPSTGSTASRSELGGQPQTGENVAGSRSEAVGSGSGDTGSGDATIQELQALLDVKKAQLLSQATNTASSSESVQPSSELLDDDPDTDTITPGGAHLEPAASARVYPTPAPMNTSPIGKRDTAKKEIKEKTKRKTRSLFPLSSTKDNRGKLHTQDDCVSLMVAKNNSTAGLLPTDQCHLGHFLDKKNTLQLFDHEASHHLQQANHEQFTVLQTFTGDIGDGVRTLAEKNELNDFTVAMSALASVQTWRQTCIQYSKQLQTEGNFPKAASYLLAAQQVYEAIDMLRNNGHYKDAICLAQARLSPQDPVIKRIYTSWGHQLASDGNFELAAKCYIANNQPIEAARLLGRRADLSALRVASEICLSSADVINARVYSLKHTQQCMMGMDWATAGELVRKHDQLQVHGLVLGTHQSLVCQLSVLSCLHDLDIDPDLEAVYTSVKASPGPGGDNKYTLPWLFLTSSDLAPWLPWKPHSVQGEAFIHHVLRLWYEHWGLALDVDNLRRIDDELMALNKTRQPQTAPRQILIELANLVTMAVIKLLLGNAESAAHWMTHAIQMCQSNQLDLMAQGMCQLLLPTGPEHFHKLYQEVRALRLSAIRREGSNELSTEELHEVSQDGLDETRVSGQRDGLLVTQNSDSIGDKSQTDDSQATQITNDRNECSSRDCLQAFYYFIVLKSLAESDQSEVKSAIAMSDRLQGSIGDGDCLVEGTLTCKSNEAPSKNTNASSFDPEACSSTPIDTKSASSISLDTPSVTVDESLDISNSSSAASGPVTPGPVTSPSNPVSTSTLRELSRSLLWSVQMEMNKLQETSAQIRRATAALISVHNENRSTVTETWPSGADTPPNSDSECSSQPQTVVYPSTPSIGDVSIDAFRKENKLMMASRARENGALALSENGHASMLQVVISGDVRRPHERILNSPLPASFSGNDQDEYVQMERSDTENQTHNGTTNQDKHSACDSKRIDASNGHDAGTDTDNGVSIGTDNTTENSNASNQTLNPSNDGENERISEEKADPKTDQSSAPLIVTMETTPVIGHDSVITSQTEYPWYPGIPDPDWHKLPLETRYLQSYVNLKLLTAEQQRVEKSIKLLGETVKNTPFPNPETSTVTLMELARGRCKQVTEATRQQYEQVTEATRGQHELVADIEQFIADLRSWALQHCYTTKTLSLLKEHTDKT